MPPMALPHPPPRRRDVIRGSIALAALAAIPSTARWARADDLLRPWSSPDTWGGTVPGSLDVAHIDSPVLLDQDADVAGVVIGPAGQLVLDPVRSVVLRSTGNVVVEGLLQMRPAGADLEHVLSFADVVESSFVGGGMEPLDSDVGLWVMEDGRLDLEGSARRGWNRTGRHETWRPGDVLLRAPFAPGDYDTYAVHVPGSRVPSVAAPDGVRYHTEVFNLTRNVRIEGTPGGPSHVFIHSRVPQHIRYVAFAHLGPRRPLSKGPADSEPVLGRYPLHFHHCEDGSRGTVVQGCVVRDSSRAFVPHSSHGITMRDCVAHRITDSAYWWDDGHETHDLSWVRCAAFDVRHDPARTGTVGGFQLGLGTGTAVSGCVAVGVHGHGSSGGFHWPSSANLQRHNVWKSKNLVAHNNASDGILVWQNDHNPHHVDGFIGYHNGSNGIHHGAYTNAYAYERISVWGNAGSDIGHQALSTRERGRQSWDDVLCEHLSLGHHNQKHTTSSTHRIVFNRLRCRRVTVDERTGDQAGAGQYILRCARGWDLDRRDIVVVSQRSLLTVVRSDGTSFEV